MPKLYQMWIQAVYNVLRERTSEFSLWATLPAWLKKFLLDVDLEHIRLRNSKVATMTTDAQ